MIQNKIRVFGVIGLVSAILSEPGLVGLGMAASMNILNLIVTYALLYMLGREHGEIKLFKSSLVQLVLFTLFIIFAGIIYNYKQNIGADTGMFYLLLGILFLVLLILAYSSYMVAKYLRALGAKIHSTLFRYSGTMLMVAAFTMPIFIGLLFFVVSFILFLVGCVLYKSPVEEPIIVK
ncbi:MAG: hypothetical protein PHC75_01535 [Burkholderiales bacterium]|nr:hypothetical protein [Burkholderiales bacterium]